MERAGNVRDIVLGSAEHDLGPVAVGQPAQPAQELVAVHLRHVPVEQDGVRHLALAALERLLAVLGLGDLEIEALQNAPGDLPDDAEIVNDQTAFSWPHSL